MEQDDLTLYKAYAARDPRFDGLFFVGVTSTGIYCRPICPAKTPRAANCRFFESAAAAEKASFRPCLRCRPELAPGWAPVDDARRIAGRIVSRLEESAPGDGVNLERIAESFGLSSRQIRRIVRDELGVSPIELLQTRRLLLAKQLLTETALPVIDIAFASGFSSLRRFNDAFRQRYGMPPGLLRREAAATETTTAATQTLTLQLAYRSPFDWEGLLRFLGVRALMGVEQVEGDEYRRTVRLGERTGWVRVRNSPERRALLVELPPSLTPALPALLARLKGLFDLSARPDVIAAHLRQDPLLADAVALNPGLRVPGAFDGFELAVRAVLGQQITVKAATTLAGRFADAFGDPIETPYHRLKRLSPLPQRVVEASEDDLVALGIVRARARSILSLARAVAEGRLTLEVGSLPDTVIRELTLLPGIGPWTAQYIAMRALRRPDAFPKEDIALRNRLGGVSAARAEALSQSWRPWRSYATLHLWQSPSPGKIPVTG